MGNTPSAEKRRKTVDESRSYIDKRSNNNIQTKYDRQSQLSTSSMLSKKPKKGGPLRKLSSTKPSTPTLGLKPVDMARQPSSSSSSTARTNSVLGDMKDCVQKLMARSPPGMTSSLERVNHSGRSTPRGSFSGASTPINSVDYFSATPYTILPPSKLGRKMSTTGQKKYCLPANAHEQDRLTNTHYVIKHCFGDNFSAPVHDLLTRSVSMAYSNNSSALTNPLFAQPSSLTPSVTNNSLPNLDNTLTNTLPSNMSSITATTTSNSSSSVKNPNIPGTQQNSWLTTAKVLDVACGSGVWVLDMASHYPDSQFYGVDCTPIFPTSIKPPNTYFQECDILEPEGLPFPDEYFDYIHMRLVYNSFTMAELKFVLHEINRVLKPGGYVELRDVQPYMKNPGPLTESIFTAFPEHMKQMYSVDITWTNNIPDILATDAGLIDIHYQEANLYYGGEGPLAAAVNACLTDPLHSYRNFFMEAYQFTPQKWEETRSRMLEEYTQNQSFLTYCMGWGRKPLVALQSLAITNPAANTASNRNNNSDSQNSQCIPLVDSTSSLIPATPIPPSAVNDSVYVYQAVPPLPPQQPPPLVSSNTTATFSSTATTTATTTPLLSPSTSTSNIMNTLSTRDCHQLSTTSAAAAANDADLFESFIIENAFDIAHLTDGFTE